MREQADAPESPPGPAAPESGGFGRIAIEMGPLLAFFATNLITRDIYWATGVFMVAIVLALIVSWRRERRLPVVPLITAVFVLVFGGLTLYLRDDLFIKLKPTVVNALFGTILLGGLVFRREFLRILLGQAMHMDDLGWRKLTLRWALFFYFLAIVNELVHRNVSTDRWVQFKTFGPVVLTVLFIVSQASLLQRHGLEEEGEDGPPEAVEGAETENPGT